VNNGKGKSKAEDDARLSDREEGELHYQLTPRRMLMAVRDVSPNASDFSVDGLDGEMGRRLQPVTYIA
jgi:hypothetical protein